MYYTSSSDTDGSTFRSSSESNTNSRRSSTLPKYGVPSGYYRSETAHQHISSSEESDVVFLDQRRVDLVNPSSTDCLTISLDPDLMSCSWLSEELIEEDFILRQISEHEHPTSYSGCSSQSLEMLCSSCGGEQELLFCRQSPSPCMDGLHSQAGKEKHSDRERHSSNCLTKSPQFKTYSPDNDQTCSVNLHHVPEPPRQSRENSTNKNLGRRQKDLRFSRIKTPKRPGKYIVMTIRLILNVLLQLFLDINISYFIICDKHKVLRIIFFSTY